MKVSICIPCMGRARDLRRTLPGTVAAANRSPPVEVVVLDYNSRDGVWNLVDDLKRSRAMTEGNELVYSHYTRRESYHMAHAYNLAVRASTGDWVVVAGADAVFAEEYVERVRELAALGCNWTRGRRCKGILAIRRSEFEAAGGYDERFELYSGEDKEFEARLWRRGLSFCLLPDGLVSVLRTPNSEKLVNFGSPLTKRQMMKMGARLRKRIAREGALVANEGKPWGKMDGPWR